MDFDQHNKEELQKKFDRVIKKSEIQVKILKKILCELNKKNDDVTEGFSISIAKTIK